MNAVTEITRRVDDLKISLINCDNAISQRMNEFERRLNEQEASAQSQQQLSSAKEAELNQKIEELQTTVNRLVQQIDFRTANAHLRAINANNPSDLIQIRADVTSLNRIHPNQRLASINTPMNQQTTRINIGNAQQLAPNDSVILRFISSHEIQYAKAVLAEFINDIIFTDEEDRGFISTILSFDMVSLIFYGKSSGVSSFFVKFHAVLALCNIIRNCLTRDGAGESIKDGLKRLLLAIKTHVASVAIFSLMHYSTTELSKVLFVENSE